MSEAEKRPYEQKAKDMKKKVNDIKYTSLGEPINSVMSRESSALDQQNDMEQNIEKLINANVNNNGMKSCIFISLIHTSLIRKLIVLRYVQRKRSMCVMVSAINTKLLVTNGHVQCASVLLSDHLMRHYHAGLFFK